MSGRRPGTSRDGRDAPLRLLPPVLVPLGAEQARQAVDALAGLLAGLLARQGGTHGLWSDGGAAPRDDVPDDDEAA